MNETTAVELAQHEGIKIVQSFDLQRGGLVYSATGSARLPVGQHFKFYSTAENAAAAALEALS